MTEIMQLTPQKIESAISAFQSQHYHRFDESFLFEGNNKIRPAAVIIPLLVHKGNWHVMLTERSRALVKHSGQVAYPGGVPESVDNNLESTALREMHEEVGIHPNEVRVFGNLGDMPVITGYVVRLFVGQIPWPYDLIINSDEVESVFIVPLNWLADPDHRTVKYRRYGGKELPVVYFDLFEDHQLWGASAEMTLTLLSALGLTD